MGFFYKALAKPDFFCLKGHASETHPEKKSTLNMEQVENKQTFQTPHPLMPLRDRPPPSSPGGDGARGLHGAHTV